MREKNKNSPGMKQKNSNKPNKKISIKGIAIYSSIGAATIALGVVGGVIVGKNVFVSKLNYGAIDIAENEQDFSETFARYKGMNKNRYFDSFSNVELANIALMNLEEKDYYYTLTTGQVIAAGVKQAIHSTYIKNQNNYFEESLSASSFVKAANRFYQNDEGISWYKGKYKDINTSSYANAKETNYTLDDFEKDWGKPVSRPCIYIISNRSYQSGELTKNNDGTYKLELNLDPTLSVLRYVKQMKMTGNLSEEPIFHKVKLIFEVDSELNILSFSTDEIYDVHMVIDAKDSKASLTQTYYYEERDIPKIDEKTNYE